MYEENPTPLRELKDGDRFITKSGSELIYNYAIDDDRHNIGIINGSSWDVPNGNYPSFKYKGNE